MNVAIFKPEVPSILQERIFRKVFDIAEVSNLNEEDMRTYEASLKDKRDWKNAMDTALAEGMEKGMEKGVEEGMHKKGMEIAKKLKQENFPIEKIASITGLSVEEVEKL